MSSDTPSYSYTCTYGRWRLARVQGYGTAAAAAVCLPACSEDRILTDHSDSDRGTLGTVTQVSDCMHASLWLAATSAPQYIHRVLPCARCRSPSSSRSPLSPAGSSDPDGHPSQLKQPWALNLRSHSLDKLRQIITTGA